MTKKGKDHSHLPPREAIVAPWHEIAVNLIGPWTMHDQDGSVHAFTELTVINTVTTHYEIIPMRNKTASHVASQLENQWLSRHPKRHGCIHDQGNEFLGEAFQSMPRKHDVHSTGSTAKNPQSDAAGERLHESIGNTLRALNHNVPPLNVDEACERINSACQTAACAARTAVHTTVKLASGAIAFHRNMTLNTPLIVDFELLCQRRQALTDENLIRANVKRVDFDYQPNQQVSWLSNVSKKLDTPHKAPHTIESVHTNGTVAVRLTPNLTKRLNVRQLKPCKN